VITESTGTSGGRYPRLIYYRRAVQRLDSQLEGPILIEPTVYSDPRGFFLETFRVSALRKLGIAEQFVQDNHSRSGRGVLRGMHFQPGMAKLVRTARGAVLDVVVDVRPESPAFKRWEGFRLDDRDHRQLYVPDGFAHGFCVLSELADVIYKTSAYYDPVAEAAFRFDDPEVGIEWPDDLELQVSARDREAPLLREVSLRA
jgi:dTDP-4-dehydrorhamnose 3,5-epimerase